MTVKLVGEAFDPWSSLHDYQSSHAELAGKFGATAVFVGTLRDMNEGAEVRAMELEHYPGMTEKYLEAISHEARTRWQLLDTLIIHRYGPLMPNDPIVLVAAWSAHRGEAFSACRYLIEELKHRAPFWKKERLAQGSRWVQSNTPTDT